MLIRIALGCALFIQLISAVNIIYDETGWTKLDWPKYKLDYSTLYDPLPSQEIIKSPEIREALAQCSLNSLDGPSPRVALKRPPGLWSLEDGSLVQSPEDDSVDAAAEAMTCTICHGLVSHVWQQVVVAIHNAEPINEAAIGDMLEEACETQRVPIKVLQKYRIVKVDAPEAGVSLFVVRMRPGANSLAAAAAAADAPAGTKSHPGTDAETAAASKACRDLSQHHQSVLTTAIWKQANEYFMARRNLGRRLLSKFELDAADTDEYEQPDTDEEDDKLEHKALQHIPEHKLMPWEALCLDMELLCPMWASMGECSANPKYMMGNSKKTGHCRTSCGKCTPDDSWLHHSIAVKELAATSSTLLNTLRNTACTRSQACMSGAGGSSTPGAAATPIKMSILHQNAEVLPGAALAKQEGFVLGKPFWAVPEVLPNPKGGSATGNKPPSSDPAHELLMSEGLSSQFVQIPGMDGFFMYQLQYQHRVYQFHQDSNSGQVTEEHVLGRYDRTATEAAAAKDRLFEDTAPNEAIRAWHAQQKALRAEAASLSLSSLAGGGEDSSGSSGDEEGGSDGSKGEQATAVTDGTTTARIVITANSRQGMPGAAAKRTTVDSNKPSGAAEDPDWKPSKTTAGSAAAEDTASLDSRHPKHAPPMLELLDYLPDTISMIDSYWPYHRQMYTGGEACGGEGKGRARSVELRVTCSPHNNMQLLIREPQFCRYIMVLYHPALCGLSRYRPVPKASLGQSAAAAAAAGREGGSVGSRVAAGSSSSSSSSSSNGKKQTGKTSKPKSAAAS